MALYHKVKSGETLFGITKQYLGLPQAQSMYKDYLKWLKKKTPKSPWADWGYDKIAEKLPAGISLTIPTPGIAPTSEKEIAPKAEEIKGVEEVFKQEKPPIKSVTPKEIVEAGAEEYTPELLGAGAVAGFPAPEAWAERQERLKKEKEKEYKMPEIEAEIEDASEKIKTFLSVKPDTVALFNKEYKSAGLEGIKTKIGALDIDVVDAKKIRNQTLFTEEGKPIPQWMITGRRRTILEDAERTIGTLIDERNALAGQYNQELGEVTAKVGMKQEDTREEAQRLQGLLDLSTGKYERVQKRISEILRGEKEAYEGELERLSGAVVSHMVPAWKEEKTKGEYQKRFKEELANLYAGMYGKEGSREKMGEILKAEFPEVDIWKDIYTRIPDGYEKVIATAEGGEKSDIEWAEEFVAGNPDATYEELFPYLKVYTKMSDAAVKNFLISKNKKSTEETGGIPGIE
jgi:hypothetical protein